MCYLNALRRIVVVVVVVDDSRSAVPDGGSVGSMGVLEHECNAIL